MTTTWHPPGAGQWKRDDVHVTSPLTGLMDELFPAAQLQGFALGFADYGALLAGFDAHWIAGRPYLRPRIAGAPAQKIWGDKPPAKLPGPGKPPPKLIFKLLFALHPELRRRAKRSIEVWEQRVWRETVRRWFDELRPSFEARALELVRAPLAALDDRVLATLVDQAAAAFAEMTELHFRHTPMTGVVVGDFMVRVREWTGASAGEMLAMLQGASPASRAGAVETAKIAKHIAAHPRLRAAVESDRPAQQIVDELTASDSPAGRALADYLEVHGWRPITGLDLYHQSLIELPELTVRALRAALGSSNAAADTTATRAAQLRARVPESARAAFDDAYAEVKLVYSLRDDDVGILVWLLGALRRVVLEAGRRLQRSGRAHAVEHVFDAKRGELIAMLRGEPAPSADELRARAQKRAELDALEPPFSLGEAGPMPPPEHFPPAVARTQRAFVAFLESMESAEHHRATDDVQGSGASPGIYEGRARLVRDIADFSAIEAGDVLVAKYTSPAYNVLLPLIGAIVTERGGLLSHAAIVAREYGIPAVVDTRNALAMIPDGGRVRVDGNRGTVEVIDATSSIVPVARVTAVPQGPDVAQIVASLAAPATTGSIVPLRDAGGTAFGGKAKALSAAIAAKLPVPDGVALDADLVEHAVRGDAAARQRIAAATQHLARPWAVRSSAIGEDSAQASFAGQHATLLGVDADELFDAIARVFASAHTDSALGYRKRMGVAGTPRMGVVIQTLLRPDISGVLFSRDPTAAREGRLVEATWGLGEALVSGIVTPDRYRIGADGTVLERAIGEKDIAIEARAGGGTAEVTVGDERARAACLDDARLAELAQLASRCEQLFGGPQDLEWAVANGQLHLLQSRPVTAQR
jgi:phosphohistidine swiveling domain-containing protein